MTNIIFKKPLFLGVAPKIMLFFSNRKNRNQKPSMTKKPRKASTYWPSWHKSLKRYQSPTPNPNLNWSFHRSWPTA